MTELERSDLTREHCSECVKDDNVFCPRNNDGMCLECGKVFCAAHLIEHFKAVHCMSLTLEHCSVKAAQEGPEECRVYSDDLIAMYLAMQIYPRKL